MPRWPMVRDVVAPASRELRHSTFRSKLPAALSWNWMASFIALHGAVVVPAAFPLDVVELGTGAVRTRGHSLVQTVTGKLRH